jgi:hypothetical protein
MKNSIAAIFGSVLIFACSNQTDKEKQSSKYNDTSVVQIELNDSVETSLNYPKRDSLFNYSVKLPLRNNYSLRIETSLKYDSVFLSEKYYSGGNQVVLSQKLFFLKGDSVLKVNEFPITELSDNKVKVNGKLVLLPKYVLTCVLYDPKNSNFISTYSFGLSNGSNEISSFYLMDGAYMVSTYCSRSLCDTIGNLNFLRSNKKYIDSVRFKEIIIFPPQSAGKSEL